MQSLNNFIPIHRPQLPMADEILPYLKKIDAARWYSNFGPLLREFEARLAAKFNIGPDQVTSASNGTLVLTAILRSFNLPANSLCIMPSWTFIATAAAAHHAGLIPYFVDVDKKTQAINPSQLKEDIKDIKGNIGAIIVVAPFGAPIDRKAWSRFKEETGIPVIIDAAAGFDATSQIPEMQIDEIPTMVSLHATKVFGVGEGGIVLCTNKLLIRSIKSIVSFGFVDGREAHSLGLNAKLSEFSAAVGLASLDRWQLTRSKWVAVRDQYRAMLDELAIPHSFSKAWISGTCNVVLPMRAKQIGKALIERGIDTRQWWFDGCHTHEAYRHFPKANDLAVTQWLSKSILGLPYSIDLTHAQLKQIGQGLQEVCGVSTEESLLASTS